MTCALCKLEEPLQKSHILPEFVYKPHYDEKHRTLLFDGRESPPTMLQKGLREPLLCRRCEGRIGRSEDYFARYWYQDHPLPAVVTTPTITLTDIDYCRFKLFMLSIVWRGAVSRLAQLRAMTLGSHEEPMRRMILEGDPGRPDKYPIIGEVLVDSDTRRPCDDVVVGPIRDRFESQWLCRMVFGGALWIVFTSNRKPSDPVVESRFLTQAGQLTMGVGLFKDFAAGSGVARAIRESLRHQRR